jgi:hypothetical protein
MSVIRVAFCAAAFLASSFADKPKLALIVTNKDVPASIDALENTRSDGERISFALDFCRHARCERTVSRPTESC